MDFGSKALTGDCFNESISYGFHPERFHSLWHIGGIISTHKSQFLFHLPRLRSRLILVPNLSRRLLLLLFHNTVNKPLIHSLHPVLHVVFSDLPKNLSVSQSIPHIHISGRARGRITIYLPVGLFCSSFTSESITPLCRYGSFNSH